MISARTEYNNMGMCAYLPPRGNRIQHERRLARLSTHEVGAAPAGAASCTVTCLGSEELLPLGL